MPITRKLTAKELQHLADQGQDTTGLDQQQFDIYTTQELQHQQEVQQAEQAGIVKGGIVPTVKSHAGSLVGGGLAGTAGWTAAAALAPETGAMSFLIPAVASAGTALIGSKAGDIIQKKVVEPTLGMTPQQQMDEQSQADIAREVYPKTSMATDIVGGALASGGSPSLKAPLYAAKGLIKGLSEEGLDPRILLGGGNPVYKSAIQNVLTGNALNTAVNAGVQLATTGQVDPKELGAAAIGGALFAEPSVLGRKLNPSWKPLEKVQPEVPSVAETIEPDGTSIADVEAYRKVAGKQAAEIQSQNQKFIQQRDAVAKMQEDQFQQMVEAQQQQDQQAQTWRRANWLTRNEDGSPSIEDNLVKKEYVRRNKIDPRTVKLPEQRALAIQRNAELGTTPVDQMRQEMFDQDAPQRDPVGWQQEVQRRQQEQDAAIQRMSDIQQAQHEMQTRQQAEQQRQQQIQDFQRAQEEERTQQLQGAEQQRQEAVQPSNPPPQVEKPLTENQRRIINPQDIAEGMSGGGLSKPREGGQLFQEAEQQPQMDRNKMSPAEMDRLLAEAGKASTGVGVVEGEGLKTPSGQQARGVSYDPQEIGKRLIGISKEYATSDTGYHELVHTMLRDLDRSPDPYHQQLAKSIREAFGGEEPAAEEIGKKYQKTVEDAANQTLPGKIGKYFSDVWAATKVNTGEGSKEDYQANLIRRMRQRSGDQDIIIANQNKGGNVGSQFQLVNPTDEESRFKPTQAALERIKTDIPTEDARNLSGKLFKVYGTSNNLLGKWWTPVSEQGKGMSSESLKRVDDVLYKEVNDKTSHMNELKTPDERKLYNSIRDVYDKSFQQRKDWNEPVYENGNPRPPRQDPFYHATTVEPKVANILKQNVDRPAIEKLSQDFIQQQLRHGVSQLEAEQNLKDEINKLRGNIVHGEGTSSDIKYNANRKAQGIPLPNSWRRQDLLHNLQVYLRRSASDLAFYHHIETDPKTMASLGYTKDPWNNPINEPKVENIAGNDSVRGVIDELKGERLGQFERNAHAMESLATIAMLGAPTEVHKTFSSMFKTVEYTENPVETAKAMVAGIQGAREALTNGFMKIKKTGYVIEDSRKAADFLNTHLTMAERLQGLAKAVRGVYTLGGLTENFTKAYLHATGEYIVPLKVEQAEQGNTRAVRLLRSLDPDYQLGKKYVGDDLQRMASEFANQVHGTRDARTLPPVMLHDNEISAFLKLSSWNIAQTNNFMRNVYTPAKQGNLRPLMMSLFGSVLGGTVIKMLREEVTGKKSPIPSWTELSSVEDARGNKIGISGNKGLAAYNLMAAASYAGFAGILSSVARYPFDMAYKNLPQGATFPLDEVVSNSARTIYNGVSAWFNDPNASLIDVSTHAMKDLLVDNVQLARMVINQSANAGIAPKSIQYQKDLSDKMSQLRRWKMATPGMEYEWQGQPQGNPYMNLGEKEFKHEQDIHKAMQEVGPLVQSIIKEHGDNPEVMLSKLKGLKQNEYGSMPSLEDMPMAFMRYVRFLRNSQGEAAASKVVNDYLQHKMLNEVKAGMVP